MSTTMSTLILDFPVVSYAINTLIMLFQPIYIFAESLDYGIVLQITDFFLSFTTIKCKLYTFFLWNHF